MGEGRLNNGGRGVREEGKEGVSGNNEKVKKKERMKGDRVNDSEKISDK